MNVTLAVVLAGLVVIGAFGVLGRRRQRELSDWTVGGRRFGGATMWFLQAGEIFTIFTFLGLAGLGFTGGVAALYALLYIPLAFVGLYFLGPRLWRRCKEEGHLTQADFVAGFFESPLLGRVVAVLGVVFVLPYLQLQITGLGLAVQLATGDRASANLGMVIAFGITVAFVLWSGIRGVATASYLKDGLMLVVLVVLAVVIPSHFGGGLGHLFEQLTRQHPAALTIHDGVNDPGWFVSSVVASGLGIMCMTLPHLWPELLAARSAKALRRNYVFLPAYCLVLVFPVFVGMAAIGVLPTGSDSNGTLLRLVSTSLPPWLVGLVVVAAAATAMVPAGGIIIGMSTLVSRNIARTREPKAQYRLTLLAVVVVTSLALALALLRPDLIANLLLLTYSGLDQLIPAIVLAIIGRRFVSWRPVLAGMLVGVGGVIALTPPFGHLHVGHVNA
ncbi:MAG TPA: sodium:solute symporter family protein, partial [Pseudonocardiaceae bacterium]|nr:sodium:solute symporter family protein [Pseudonocardiaceae bacterium]